MESAGGGGECWLERRWQPDRLAGWMLGLLVRFVRVFEQGGVCTCAGLRVWDCEAGISVRVG